MTNVALVALACGLIIGLGAIGVLVCNACEALGMEVIGYAPRIRRPPARADGTAPDEDVPSRRSYRRCLPYRCRYRHDVRLCQPVRRLIWCRENKTSFLLMTPLTALLER